MCRGAKDRETVKPIDIATVHMLCLSSLGTASPAGPGTPPIADGLHGGAGLHPGAGRSGLQRQGRRTHRRRALPQYGGGKCRLWVKEEASGRTILSCIVH